MSFRRILLLGASYAKSVSSHSISTDISFVWFLMYSGCETVLKYWITGEPGTVNLTRSQFLSQWFYESISLSSSKSYRRGEM